MLLDCKGMLCPKPVILVKQELEKEDFQTITVEVDNEVAVNNLKKLAETMGVDVHSQGEEGAYQVIFTKRERMAQKAPQEKKSTHLVIAVGKATMGEGEKELGEILMKSFFYAVSEDPGDCKDLLFFHGGIHLTTEGSPILEDLKSIEKAGINIYVCGTCLEYYKKKDQLLVGQISNMYTMYETMAKADRLIQL